MSIPLNYLWMIPVAIGLLYVLIRFGKIAVKVALAVVVIALCLSLPILNPVIWQHPPTVAEEVSNNQFRQYQLSYSEHTSCDL